MSKFSLPKNSFQAAYLVSLGLIVSLLFGFHFLFVLPTQNQLNVNEEIEHTKAYLSSTFEFIQPALRERDVDFLQNFVSSYATYPGISQAHIISPSRTIVASSNIALEDLGLVQLNPVLKDQVDRFFAGNSAQEEWFNKESNVITLMVELPFPPDSNGIGGYERGILLIQQQIEPLIVSSKKQLLKQTVTGSVVGLLVIVLIHFGIIRPYLRRLNRLTVAISAIELGQPITLDAVNSNDEIGKLTNAFSILLKQMSQYTFVLNRQNAVLKAQSDGSPAGILVTGNDPARPYVEWNQRFLSMWELPDALLRSGNSEAVGQVVRDKVEDPDNFYLRIQHLQSNLEEEVWGETIYLKKHQYFERYSKPILAGDGSAIGRIWFYFDVTERNLEKERFVALFENAASANIVIEEDGQIVMTNKLAQELFQMGNCELCRQNIHNLLKTTSQSFAGNDINIAQKDYQEAIENHEVTALTHGGKSVPVLVSTNEFPFHDEKQKILCIQDITQQKLLESQVLQAQKMEAIGRLAGGVAHDYNNQLTAILGFSELIAESSNIEEIHAYIQKVSGAAEHSKELTHQLLSFARKNELTNTRVNAHKQIQDVVELLQHSVNKNINFELSLSAPNSSVFAEQTMLKNILINIVLNANDALPRGGNIYITTQASAHPKELKNISESTPNLVSKLKIEIRDDGVGIEERDLEHIFEPFFTTKEIGKGTGMGLASAYGAIKKLNGDIQVDSVIGKGTVFSIFLPLAPSNTIESKQPNESKAKPRQTAQSKTVLIVDDEPAVRELIASALTDLGHRYITAESGQEALKIYQTQWRNIDLVILDNMMPIMNGQQTLQQLQQINSYIKVIGMSGHAQTNNFDLLIQHPRVYACIKKPFNVTQIREVIREVLHSNTHNFENGNNDPFFAHSIASNLMRQ